MKKSHWRPLLFLSLFAIFMELVSVGYGFFIWVAFVPFFAYVLTTPFKKYIGPLSAGTLVMSAFFFNWVSLYDATTLVVVVLGYASFFIILAVCITLVQKIFDYKKTRLFVFIPAMIVYVETVIFSFTLVDSFWAEFAMYHTMSAPLIWFVGARGVTFLIIVFNTILALLLIKIFAMCKKYSIGESILQIVKKEKALVVAATFLIVIFSASFVYSFFAQPYGEKLKVALIQGNFPQSWEWRKIYAGTVVLDRYEKLTDRAMKYNPDLIVWPEYAIAADLSQSAHIKDRIAAIAKRHDALLVLGSFVVHDEVVGGFQAQSDVVNVFGRSGALEHMYASYHPQPYEPWVVPGDALEAVPLNKENLEEGYFGPLLCYEENLGFISRTLVADGAEFFIVLSNNQRFEQSKGIYLAPLHARLRAAEHYKYLVRVTNTGLTQVINPYGKVVDELAPFEQGVLVAEIARNDRETFYARYGDVLVMLFGGGVIILLVYSRCRSLIR